MKDSQDQGEVADSAVVTLEQTLELLDTTIYRVLSKIALQVKYRKSSRLHLYPIGLISI